MHHLFPAFIRGMSTDLGFASQMLPPIQDNKEWVSDADLEEQLEFIYSCGGSVGRVLWQVEQHPG